MWDDEKAIKRIFIAFSERNTNVHNNAIFGWNVTFFRNATPMQSLQRLLLWYAGSE